MGLEDSWIDLWKENKIKYGKKKSRKEVSAKEYIPALEKFLATLWFRILPSLNEDKDVDALRGHFPPYLCFNIDQCPLLFFVGQDTTFTIVSDNSIHIKCSSEALCKRQFIMHIVFDTGREGQRQG